MVNKGIKLRLYPNKEQEKQLNNMFGNNRFLWNLLLEMQQVRYKLFGLSCMSAYTMDSLVTQLKKVYPFLKLSIGNYELQSTDYLDPETRQYYRALCYHVENGEPLDDVEMTILKRKIDEDIDKAKKNE